MKTTILCLWAMCSAAISGAASVDWGNRTQVLLFALGIVLAGLGALKAVYVESPNQSEK